jgi:hypothetical protein
MNNLNLVTCMASVITLILLIMTANKVLKRKEKYTVDISGGFAPPCNNCGDCVAYTNCPGK